jgi:hypothetical protein
MRVAGGVDPAPHHRLADTVRKALGLRPRAAVDRPGTDAVAAFARRAVARDDKDAVVAGVARLVDDQRADQLAVAAFALLERLAERAPVVVSAGTVRAKARRDRGVSLEMQRSGAARVRVQSVNEQVLSIRL